MPNYSYKALAKDYKSFWDSMEIVKYQERINDAAQRIINHRAIYEKIEAVTNVPWYVIGLIHLRESNCDFDTHLHNGDPLTARTRNVPRGRPKSGKPPFDFVDSAIDALNFDGASAIKDWTIERIAWFMEKYNGFGYRNFGIPSPYLWSGSNKYDHGKFVSDGRFNAGVVDQQIGVMPVLKVIMESEVKVAETPAPVPEPPVFAPAPKAEIPAPTNKEMRQNSRKFYATEFFKWLFYGGGGTAAATKALDTANIQATRAYLDVMKSFISDYGATIFILACIAGAAVTILIRQYMKEDVQEGRYEMSGK